MKSKINFEIEESMAKLLTPKYVKTANVNSNVASAMVKIVKAADILDNLKVSGSAELLTIVLEQLPQKIQK